MVRQFAFQGVGVDGEGRLLKLLVEIKTGLHLCVVCV